MKMLLGFIAIVVLFGMSVTPSFAGTFSDNFNDGNANGWWLGYSQHTPWVSGNWRVENGVLLQDQAGDAFIALVDNILSSDQTIETQVKLNDPSGYGGITLWFKDDNNWVNVFIYPAVKEVWVLENIGGTDSLTRYPFSFSQNNTWHTLKVEADSENGSLDVYVDGEYLFTHNATTSNHFGKSGVHNGNAGGAFDNFLLSSDSIADPVTNKNQCKNQGWKVSTTPLFKNQGACVSYFESK